MDDFLTWCQKREFDPSPEGIDTSVKKEGSTKRAGVRSHAYPELYSRGQYPDLALTPTAADAATYLDKK